MDAPGPAGGGPGRTPPGISTSVEGSVAERLSGISAFFPCYNDAGSIEEMVRRVNAVLPCVADTFDITVIDDGSADNSVALLECLRAEIPALSIVRHVHNRGYGGALRSGFAAATKEFVFYTDGDGQYDPRELPKLVALMEDGIGLVNGYKLGRSDPLYRKVTGGTYEWIARRVFGTRIKDVDCDFRLIRTEYLRRVPLTFESGAIGLELVYRLQSAGCRMRETGVHHYPRLHGRSEFFSLKHVTSLIGDVLRFWWSVRRGRQRWQWWRPPPPWRERGEPQATVVERGSRAVSERGGDLLQPSLRNTPLPHAVARSGGDGGPGEGAA